MRPESKQFSNKYGLINKYNSNFSRPRDNTIQRSVIILYVLSEHSHN